MGRRPGALVALALALVSACGTTVPLTSTRTVTGTDGAVSPTSPTSSAAGTTGSGLLPGTSTSGGGTTSDGTTTTGPGSTSGGGTGSTPGATSGTGTAPPVTDRSPLTVGVTYINNDATSQALGVSDDTTASKQNVIRALVRGINLRGGLNGRKLKVVEYEWNSQGNNWSADANAACTRFTQDNHVAVVLDNAFGTTGGFRDCLAKRGVLSIQNGPEGDGVSSAAARLHANTYNLTTDRAYVAVLEGLAATGYLARTSRVGVIIESCAETSRAWSRSVQPRLRQLVTAAPQVATVQCTGGFADAGAAASAVSNDVLRFRSAGVDRVMFVSDNEAVLLLLFGSAAGSQGYTPGYLLSSGALAQGIRSQIPANQQPQLHGVGQQRFSDVDGAPLSAADNRCRSLSRAGGVTAATYADYGILTFECGPLLLLERALEATGGVATPPALAAAIQGLGTSFAAPGLVGDATAFTARRHDGPSQARVFGYVAGCTCIHYSGPIRPV